MTPDRHWHRQQIVSVMFPVSRFKSAGDTRHHRKVRVLDAVTNMGACLLLLQYPRSSDNECCAGVFAPNMDPQGGGGADGAHTQ